MFHGIKVLAGEMASTAKASLQKVITWCTTDAAGPSLGLLRGALLDLASLLLAEGALPGALACLQSAAASGTCRDALLSAPQVWGPITATAVPAWAIQLLQGRFLHLLFAGCPNPLNRSALHVLLTVLCPQSDAVMLWLHL